MKRVIISAFACIITCYSALGLASPWSTIDEQKLSSDLKKLLSQKDIKNGVYTLHYGPEGMVSVSGRPAPSIWLNHVSTLIKFIDSLYPKKTPVHKPGQLAGDVASNETLYLFRIKDNKMVGIIEVTRPFDMTVVPGIIIPELHQIFFILGRSRVDGIYLIDIKAAPRNQFSPSPQLEKLFDLLYSSVDGSAKKQPNAKKMPYIVRVKGKAVTGIISLKALNIPQ